MRSAVVFSTVMMMFGLAKAATAETAYDFSFTSIDGDAMPLAQFDGKAVLVVNTASACGFTPQYDELQELYQAYQDKGLVVLGVPSNDFGNQEPLSEESLKEFCEVNFSITFPITEKEQVKGKDAHPFYQWAADELGMMAKPRWNFHKYLIGPDGRLLDWFSTTTSPLSPKVKAAVEKALAS
ncbi:MAG: glutathione peroxidase [Alphaproteobacteria bacterium]|nr:glutathione peroxidase [Alphaproteobacteria bacterium]